MLDSRFFTADDYARRAPEGCGVVGVYNHPQAARLCHLALHAMQHRGQESAGIVAFDGSRMLQHRGQGLVNEVFDAGTVEKLNGRSAIGHVRYSTTGSSVLCNAQPLLANYRGGQIAVAHNGNLTNADVLSRELEALGSIFQSTTDSELLLHLVARHPGAFDEALVDSLERLVGAFSMTVLHDGDLYAAKDPWGFRPLCLGSLGNDSWIVASESCALDIVGATFLREFKPGEVIAFRNGTIDLDQLLEPKRQSFCVFEFIYYSRPDSIAAGSNIYKHRRRLGEELARECPADADVVIAVPDSSNAAATGFAAASGLPLELGLIRSHYVGRTFIQPDPGLRSMGAKLKYNPVRDVLAGRRVAVVDDSIVRGTTARQIVRLIREAGAKEVHFRASAPPWRHPCFYGIDTPDEENLLANRMDADQMRDYLDVDTLGFISPEGLMRAMPKTIGYCTACFSGDYPAGRPQRSTKFIAAREEPAARPTIEVPP